MHNFRVFLFKELMENLLTKKVFVLACVFLFFAMTAPLLTRFMGEFLAFVIPGDDTAGQAMAAMMGEMGWQDSYAQFYGNIGQIGVFTILLLFMGIILREKQTGSIDLVFTKGLSPAAFVLSKFTVASILTVIMAVVAVVICFAYTLVLFDEGGQLEFVLLGALVFGVFACMIVAITIFCSAFAKSTATSAVMGMFIYLSIIVIGSIPHIGRFSPSGLAVAMPTQITMGIMPDDLILGVVMAVVISALALWAATYLTATKQYSN